MIETLGLWAHRWVKRGLRREELDPSLLMWDIRRRVATDSLPADRRTVVQFDLGGVPHAKSRWWLVFDRGEVDLCWKNPGYDVDLHVSSNIRDLVDVWMGHLDLKQAVRSESVKIEGPRPLVRGFPDWFKLSLFVELSEM